MTGPEPTRVRALTAGALLLVAAGLLTACGPDGTGSSGAKDTGATPTAGATATTAQTVQTTKAAKPVPDLVGMGLQAAQDAAQADGVFALKSHDSLGEDRHQILDRDWKVCTQSPAAGKTVPTDTTLDLGAVKVTETCPKGGDAKPPAKTGKTMPDFVGKGLAAARDSLPSDASIITKDASGEDRIIIVESDWKVCTQDPAPGAAFTGQPVAFTAVKTDETCP